MTDLDLEIERVFGRDEPKRVTLYRAERADAAGPRKGEIRTVRTDLVVDAAKNIASLEHYRDGVLVDSHQLSFDECVALLQLTSTAA